MTAVHDIGVLNDLTRLFPLGVLEASGIALTAPEPDAPDGWHWLPTCREYPDEWRFLQILQQVALIRLTYAVIGRRFVVRVYAVPEDVRTLDVRLNGIGRAAFQTLLERVGTNPACWDLPCVGDRHALLQPRTKPLAAMYADIASPRITDVATTVQHERFAFRAIGADTIYGLKSSLYPYQVRTVHAMLRHEIYPERFLDPRLVRVRDDLYIDCAAQKFWRHPAWYACPRGGLLGEEMGTGKTCEMLALILASLGQTARNPVFELESTVRRRETACGLSLRENLAAQINRQNLPYRTEEDLFTPLAIEYLHKHRQRYEIPPPVRALRSAVKPDTRPGTEMHITHATLIVVPDTLVAQWRHEIAKHVQEDMVRVLVVASTNRKHLVPPVEELLKYDIVLVSHARFGREEALMAQPRAPCNCAYVGSTRDIICTCPPPISYHSPLASLHWLRIVVDEGHTMSASKTKAVRFAAQLVADRRWMVSGTPSRGLIGVDMDGYGHDERRDLDRLGITFCDFLGLEGYDIASWKRHVTRGFLVDAPGSAAAVQNIMDAMIVRNRAADIDVALPPLSREVVFLDPTPENVRSQNVFSALIAINAVTSQRVDQDYLFSKVSAPALQQLVRNLLGSTFWWNGTSVASVQAALDIARNALKKHDYPKEDADLLVGAIRILDDVRHYPIWLACANTTDSLFYLSDPLPEGYAIAGRISGGSMLTEAQRVVRALSSKPDDLDWDDYLEDELLQAAALKSRSEKRDAQSSLGSSPKRIKTQHVDLDVPLAGESLYEAPSTSTSKKALDLTLLEDSSFGRLTVHATGSAKLNYLMRRLIALAPAEKCIVFTESADHAYYLAEALDVCGIAHLIFTHGLSSARKSQYVLTFNVVDTFRVMVMDLQLAAHGLNLSTASRVFFVQKSWSPALERQAIKRAHRIGQTRPVHVETLVLKGTVEEALYRRRARMTGAELGRERSAAEDDAVRSYIRHPKFVPEPAQSNDAFAARLFAPRDDTGGEEALHRE